MKAVALVPVRLTSTRLPEKHLKLIGDKPLLSWVLERLKSCSNLDEIVICAPDEPKSNELKSFCQKENVKLYIHEGKDANDVVGRLTEASKVYQADICVLASGDCPLISPSTIDKLVAYLREHPEIDGATIAPKKGKKPIHEGISVVRRHVWELAEKFSDTPALREHQFPVLRVYPEKFSHLQIAAVEDDDIFYNLNHRISVDTPSDLEFMNSIYKELKKRGKVFDLKNVIDLLVQKPEIMEINRHVYRKGLNDRNLKVFFVVSAVKNYGYGNLVRALEIARFLTDFGIGVSFAVLDEEAFDICKARSVNSLIIGKFESIVDYLRGHQAVVFDLNKDVEIPAEFVLKLREEGLKVVFIDNVKAGARFADKIVIPTAHYTGKEAPNLVWGGKYVVIRKEIQEIAKRSFKKRGIIAKVDDCYREKVKDIWIDVEFLGGFSGNFPEKLAESALAILHLGISCYEAIYLKTAVIVIPRKGSEVEEIKRFYEFAVSEEVKELGNGARNIAELIKEFLQWRYR